MKKNDVNNWNFLLFLLSIFITVILFSAVIGEL